MTPSNQELLRALELNRTIKTLTIELDQLKASFAKAASGADADYVAPSGDVIQVRFPDPKLISGFFLIGNTACVIDPKKKTVKLGDIKTPAGKHFDKLFAPWFKPAKAFRELATALLPKPELKKILDMCQTEQGPRVSFQAAQSTDAQIAA